MRLTLSDDDITKLRQRLSSKDYRILEKMKKGWQMAVSPAGLVRLCFLYELEFPNVERVRRLEKFRLVECTGKWLGPSEGERGGWGDFRGFEYILSPSGDKMATMTHCPADISLAQLTHFRR